MVKVGDKFIIEIDEIFESGLPFGGKLYRAKGFKSLVFDEIGINKLTPYKEEQVSVGYNYKDGEVLYSRGDMVLIPESNSRGIIIDVFKGNNGRRTYVVLDEEGVTMLYLSEELQKTPYKFQEMTDLMERMKNICLPEELGDDWMEDQI